jgi:hypothetical protein
MMLTQHNDNARTGVTIAPALNRSAFSTWRLKGMLHVDGTVWAQPLVMSAALLPDGQHRDLVFIATATNKVYAFDAGNLALVWGPVLLGPYDHAPAGDQIGSPVRIQHASWDENGRWNGKFEIGIGIQSTPVIDPGSATLFVSYRSATTSPLTRQVVHHQFLAAMDVRTGAVLRTGECLADPTTGHPAPGFDINHQRQRTGLLLLDGVVYMGFGSLDEEYDGYHGWIIGFEASMLRQVAAFNTTPSEGCSVADNEFPPCGKKGGIWQASNGLTADDAGNIYFITGDGHFDPAIGNYGGSFVKLGVKQRRLRGRLVNVELNVVDYFTPFNQRSLNRTDLDLGSAGPVLLPATSYLLGGGKEGWMYLLDRNKMGHNHLIGSCSAGGGHEPIGWNFVLPHDVTVDANHQDNWHFCGKCADMFWNGDPKGAKGVCPRDGAGHIAAGWNFVLPHDLPEGGFDQSQWRFCGKCFALFWNADQSGRKGLCPKDGLGHWAEGFNFVVAHDVPSGPTLQPNWRFCGKCFSMFWDEGDPQVIQTFRAAVNQYRGSRGIAGPCGTGAANHRTAATSYYFVLPHDVPETPTQQAKWRFCVKCFVIFWSGDPKGNQGFCKKDGGGHHGMGFDFVLPHDDPATATQQDDWRFCTKCFELFWAGDPTGKRGVCPRDTKAHAPMGFNFGLPHDFPPGPSDQGDWRFCIDCFALYFDEVVDLSIVNDETHRRPADNEDWLNWPHIHGSPVYHSLGANSGLMYVWPEKDILKSFELQGNRFTLRATMDARAPAAPPGGMPGGLLSLAVGNGQSRDGVVFASLEMTAYEGTFMVGRLLAFDAATLELLWDNGGEPVYVFSKFCPPTVATDRVLLPTFSNEVRVYGP